MKILFILSRFPYPLEKGDKLRAYQHLRAMSKIHEVHLVALSDIPVDSNDFKKVSHYCKSVHVIRLTRWKILYNLINAFIQRIPFQVGYFFNPGIKMKISHIISGLQPDVIYCQLIRTALYAGEGPARKMIDFQDAFRTNTYQRLEKAHPFLKPVYKREYDLVSGFEEKIIPQFDLHFVISERDKAQIGEAEHENIIVLPNGVDTESFVNPSPQAGRNILFVGNMNYPPNIDAARFLVDDIMPKVWERNNDLILTIAGANPSAEVRKLQSSNVRITGWVDDIRDEYRKASIFIAPMRMGTGLQNKLIEAMSMSLGCITTSLSAHPLNAADGEHLIVRDSAEDLAKAINELTEDPEGLKRLGTRARDFVQKEFSLDKYSELLLTSIESLK